MTRIWMPLRSHARHWPNLTLIGANNDEGKRGIRLRAGTQAKIYNALVTGKANNLTTETEQTEKFLIDGPRY